MFKKYRLWVSLTALCLSACSAPSSSHEQVKVADTDICGASHYQSYLGQPLKAIKGKKFPVTVRAIGYLTPVTLDFNPTRLNFSANKEGNISRIYCG